MAGKGWEGTGTGAAYMVKWEGGRDWERMEDIWGEGK